MAAHGTQDAPARDPGVRPPQTTRDDFGPRFPIAKRVNRNVLTIAATISGVIVIVAVLFLTPRGPSKHDRELGNAAATPVVPPTTYLDQGPSGTRDYTPTSAYDPGGSAPQTYAPPYTAVPDGAPGSRSVPTLPSPTSVDPYMAAAASSPAPAPPSPREQAYLAALKSRPMVGEQAGPTVAPATASAVGTDGPGAMLRGAGADASDLTAAVAGLPGPFVPVTGSTPPAQRPVGRAGQAAFLANARAAQPTRVTTSVEPAASPYMVQAGTLVPGILVTGINSDLPGEIVGQVSRDVYDSRTQRIRLIPKGARLIGRYDNEIALGQNRLLVAWTRLIFPDGRSIALPGLAITDPRGASGVRDRVNNHYTHVFGTAVLLSLISAGAQLSQPRQATNIYAVPTAGQTAAGAVGAELSRVAAQVLERNLDIQPTVSIRQGQPFAVFLNADLTFPGPYVDERR